MTQRGSVDEKQRRREAREAVGAYHQEQLRSLLEHVRAGFGQLDAGVIDEFELDEIVHHYKKSAAKLWGFCNGSTDSAASAIAYFRERGNQPDWWEAGASRSHREAGTSDSG